MRSLQSDDALVLIFKKMHVNTKFQTPKSPSFTNSLDNHESQIKNSIQCKNKQTNKKEFRGSSSHMNNCVIIRQ